MREEGHKFSDEPTNEEIEKARREYELRKEKEDLDASVIISHSRKRGNVSNDHDDGRDLKKPNGKTSSTENSGNSNGPAKPSSSTTPVIQKRRVIDDDSDGEAEF